MLQGSISMEQKLHISMGRLSRLFSRRNWQCWTARRKSGECLISHWIITKSNPSLQESTTTPSTLSLGQKLSTGSSLFSSFALSFPFFSLLLLSLLSPSPIRFSIASNSLTKIVENMGVQPILGYDGDSTGCEFMKSNDSQEGYLVFCDWDGSKSRLVVYDISNHRFHRISPWHYWNILAYDYDKGRLLFQPFYNRSYGNTGYSEEDCQHWFQLTPSHS